MKCRLGRRPVAAVVCVVSLAAPACGTSDNEQPSDQAATSTATTTPGNDQDLDPTTSAAARRTHLPDRRKSNDQDLDPTTSAAPPDTTTTTSAAAPDTTTTTSTKEPVDLAVSPWPADPRVTEDREWGVRIETSWHHQTDAFTQGLETDGTIIYESTGLYGESRLRALDGADELRSVAIVSDLFGEGLTLVGDEIIQLSWREGRALRWDRTTLEPRGEFRYEGEGWGICWDQVRSRLLMSDGTSTLTHRNRDDFAVVATTTITRNDAPVERINELECVEGLVVANIWMTNEIIVFDPDSGVVLASIDAALLAAEAGISPVETHAVLNGVAYNGNGKWILGGKNWPLQFLVTFTLN